MSLISRRQFARIASVSMIGLAVAPQLFAQTAATAPEPKNRALFSVTENDPARWRLILGNMYNIKTGVGDEGAELELVAYGPGLNMLKADSPVKDMIAEAVKAGVKVNACQNTMRGMKLTPDDILPGVTYVPAGVIEVMRKQQQGWAYIRS